MALIPEERQELQWKCLLLAAWRTELALEMELRELAHDIHAFRIRIKAWTPLERELLRIINLAAELAGDLPPYRLRPRRRRREP